MSFFIFLLSLLLIFFTRNNSQDTTIFNMANSYRVSFAVVACVFNFWFRNRPTSGFCLPLCPATHATTCFHFLMLFQQLGECHLFHVIFLLLYFFLSFLYYKDWFWILSAYFLAYAARFVNVSVYDFCCNRNSSFNCRYETFKQIKYALNKFFFLKRGIAEKILCRRVLNFIQIL